MKPLIARTLALASSNIGKREIGRTNSGPEVSAWLRVTSVPNYQPWCAAFVYAMFAQAAAELGVDNPMVRTGFTPNIYNWAKGNDILVNSRDGRPEAGDVFLVRGSVRIHHTGFVRSVERDSWTSIEGNSNDEGSREGYEVACNTRKPFHERYYWVRVSRLCPDVPVLTPTCALYLGGQKTFLMPLAGEIALCPVRTWGEWMKKRVDWIGGETPILLNGRPLESELTMIGGVAYAPIDDLVANDPTLMRRRDKTPTPTEPNGRVLVTRR